LLTEGIVYILAGFILSIYGAKIIEFVLLQYTRLKLQTSLIWTSRYKFLSPIYALFTSISTTTLYSGIKTLSRLIESNILNLSQGLKATVILSLGPVLASHIWAFDVGIYSLLLILAGFLYSKWRKVEGEFALGIGFIFYSLHLLEKGLLMVKANLLGEVILAHISTNLFIGFLIGFFIPLCLRNEIPYIVFGIALSRTSALFPIGTLGIFLGGGIAFSTILYLKTNVEFDTAKIISRKLLLGNILFKFFIIVITLLTYNPLFPPIYSFTESVASEATVFTRTVLNLLTLICLCSAGIIIILYKPFLALLNLIPGQPKSSENLEPAITIKPKKLFQIVQENIQNIMNFIGSMFQVLLEYWEGNVEKKSVKMRKLYEEVYNKKTETSKLLNKALKKVWTEQDKLKEVQYSGILNNLEKMAYVLTRQLTEVCLQIEDYLPYFEEAKVADLFSFLKKVIEEYESMFKAFVSPEKELSSLRAIGYEVEDLLNETRRSYTLDELDKELEGSGIRWVYSNYLTLLEHIHTHIQKIGNLMSRL